MIPSGLVVQSQHNAAVKVQVESDPSTVQLSTLPPQEFQKAIEKAIAQSKLFVTMPDGQPTYRLTVKVASLDAQAAYAWDRQVRLVASWDLTRSDTGQSVWKDLIATKFVTTTKDASFGLERTKLSTEGAARENIREAIEQLARLSLR